MRKVSAAAILAIALVAATLDLLGSPQRNREPLTNQAVVKLLGAGLSEDIVVRMVKTLPGNYALGPDDLVELKKAGASNEIIKAMMERQPPAAPAPADPAPGPAAAIDGAAPAPAKSPARPVEGTAPNVPFEPGLYAQRKGGFARI